MLRLGLIVIPLIIATLVDGKYGEWSSWSKCSKTCSGGTQTRKRICISLSGGICEDPIVETKACVNDFCKGPAGLAKAQELVKTFLESYQKKGNPDKEATGKFYRSVFAIQMALAEEFISVDATSIRKSTKKRLDNLEKTLKVANKGGSKDFERNTLGKGLYTFMKTKIEEKTPIDEIDKAAEGYLNKLREDVGNDMMNDILSSRGDATLMFTIDTTGSMADEINAAKAVAKQIISTTRDFKVDYILSPFNDPGTGPVTYRSEKDSDKFVTDIDALTANGGGDCPELAFKGMFDAINEGPRYGSPMFVFTDASAKDENRTNIEQLKSASQMTGAFITFFTNFRGCSGIGIDSYKEIASSTGGQIFALKSESEILKFTEYVKSSLQQDTALASGGGKGRRSKRSISKPEGFVVDDSLTKITVSISVSNSDTASSVELFNPANNRVYPSNTMSMSLIFEISNPKPGFWRLVFPSHVGEHNFKVNGVSKNVIEFAYNFVYQQNVRRNSPPISMPDPFKGRKNMMVIRLAGADRIDLSSIRLNLIDESDNILQANIKTDRLDSDDVQNATIIPPKSQFKVQLTGKTKTGFSFQRTSSGISLARSIYLRPLYAGIEFTANIGSKDVRIMMQCINKGAVEVLQFEAKAVYGTLTTPKIQMKIRTMGFVGFEYNPPTSISMKGKVDTITVTGTRNSDGENFSQYVSIILV